MNEPPRLSTLDASRWDAIVFGAGTAGIIAAIQSARAGARTLLVERTGCPGGTMVNARVSSPGTRFSAWGRQVVGGIPWEMVCACYDAMGKGMPSPDSPINLNPGAYAVVVEEAFLRAGGTLLYHAMPHAVRRSADEWRLTMTLKGETLDLRARVLVDCTGDADVVRLIGLPVRRPEQRQPDTYMFWVDGYDYSALDIPRIKEEYAAAVVRGEQSTLDLQWGIDSFLKHHGDNTNHVITPDGATSPGRTVTEVSARATMLRLIRFLRRQPGLADLRISELPAECGVRETVTIVGRTRMTTDAYMRGHAWPDALCYSFAPIDLHRIGEATKLVLPDENAVPTIPRGAMLPQDADWIVCAGRIADGDREAHSAFRLQASCMAMGQAAGAMAALAARSGTTPHALDLAVIRNLLRQYGAIVPGDGASAGIPLPGKGTVR